jgi:hypothetical protein
VAAGVDGEIVGTGWGTGLLELKFLSGTQVNDVPART